jgi:MSHA pilin protein MshD
MPMWGTVLTKFAAQQRGLTLIELVAVIIILAIAMTGVTIAVSGAIARTSDTLIDTRAVALAQSYLDEILGKRFDENSAPRGIPPCRSDCSTVLGPEPGETRQGFDDVDDYHGLDEGDDPLNPLRDSDGNTRAGYDNFRVQVTVRYVEPCGAEASWFNLANAICNPADPDEIAAATPIIEATTRAAKLVTVNVLHRENPSGWRFSAYKVNF